LLRDSFAAFFVLDGMGGHAGGSTAARIGTDTVRGQLDLSEADYAERIASAVKAANLVIHQQAREDRSLRGMGTTVVVLLLELETPTAWWAHVGDSRIYLVREHTIRRLTRDHTMVQSLVDDGIISREEARNHPRANMISRSLGARPEVEVDVSEPFTPLDGDIFVLCSDGLSGLVDEEEIAETVRALEPEEAVARLIERANEEGGPDNITVQVVLWGDCSVWKPVETWDVEHPPILRTRRRDEEEAPESSDTSTRPSPPVATDAERILDGDGVPADSSDGDEDPLSTLLLAVLLGVVVVALLAIFSRGPLDRVPPPAQEPAAEGSAPTP
jgi:serine/threonine protein phosphatase PrpC